MLNRFSKLALVLMTCGGLLFMVGSARAATLNVPGGFATIQDAIDAAVSGVDEVVVAQGTYNEVINFLGKAITVRSSSGAAVTTIDGTGLNDSVVKRISGEGPDTVLDGFTITGGTGDSSLFGSDPVGGGMFNNSSSPTVTNCTLSGNSAHFGGGMYNLSSSSPTVTNCTFSGNTATTGGGMFNRNSSSPTVTDCTFSGNSAGSGGGMANLSSSPTVTNCTFSGNGGAAGFLGGGMI